MNRFSFQWFCLTFLALSSVVSASLEGIDLPDVKHVNGVPLVRNGQGVRSITFLGMDIKIYVAGFYSQVPLRSEHDVMDCREGPMQLDFTFLRTVNKGRVSSAWSQQLAHSVSYTYDGYESDRDAFISMFGPIAYKGTQTVQLVGDNTVIVDQGETKGVIPGRNFQRAFLSMWFGERAVAEDLKAGLLSGASHLLEDARESPIGATS